jgi:muconolactone delta-isomerase
MRFLDPKTLVLIFLLTTLSPASLAATAVSTGEASKHLPNNLGEFKAASPAIPFEDQSTDKIEPFGVVSAAIRSYQSKKGENLSVALVVTRSESGAYALLTNSGCPGGHSENAISEELGTSQCVFPARILFARGPVFVEVELKKGDPLKPEVLKSFASLLAPTLDKGEDDVPVLVKHLPDWESAQRQILYAINPTTLKYAVSNQPILDAVSFEGGAEAAVASYDVQKLVVVEFNTASLATDNNQRISAKIQDLQSQGQPVPAYRRVGNYAVFVFNAPSQEAANQLIDQVKYQQVVQWLGENPFSYEKATREFTETTLGVFVSVVKASGLALVTCLGVGGLFGTLLFRVRRSQQRAREAYADSDAMLRLNLDELTPESDRRRLLGPGN